MDKICKRCQFRTPQTRAICQVCGHTKFENIDNLVSAHKEVTTSRQEAQSAHTTSLSPTSGSASSTWSERISASIEELATKIKSASHKVAALCTISTKVASEDPSQTASKLLKNRLGDPANGAAQPSSAPRISATPKAAPVMKSVQNLPPAAVASSSTEQVLENLRAAANCQLNSTQYASAPQKESLTELLHWFQSFGTESQILAPEKSNQDLRAQDEIASKNIAA